MHRSVMNWIASRVANYQLAHLDTLEVGALNINGSIRGLFTGEYLATDMMNGRGVDRVVNAHCLYNALYLGDYKDGFDVIVCCEMLEHDDEFWTTFEQIESVTKDGGHLLLTTRGIGFPLHEYPSDYWRFTKDAIRMLAERNGFEVIALDDDPQAPGVFLHAVKS